MKKTLLLILLAFSITTLMPQTYATPLQSSGSNTFLVVKKKKLSKQPKKKRKPRRPHVAGATAAVAAPDFIHLPVATA